MVTIIDAPTWLILSGITASSFAILSLLAPDTFLALSPAITQTNLDGSVQLYFAITMAGWSSGKFACAMSGASASSIFCRINCVPMVGMVYSSYVSSAWDLPIWAFFLIIYAYFGFLTRTGNTWDRRPKHWASKSID